MIYRLLREILSWESIEVSQKANGFIYSAKDRLKMMFKTLFRVKHLSMMVVTYPWVYQSVIEIDNCVARNSLFLCWTFFLSLSSGIWIKLHFPLKSPSLFSLDHD